MAVSQPLRKLPTVFGGTLRAERDACETARKPYSTPSRQRIGPPIVAGMLAATFLVWALAITAPNSTAIEIEYGAQDQVFQGNRFPREQLALLEAMRSGPIALRGGWAALFRV